MDPIEYMAECLREWQNEQDAALGSDAWWMALAEFVCGYQKVYEFEAWHTAQAVLTRKSEVEAQANNLIASLNALSGSLAVFQENAEVDA